MHRTLIPSAFVALLALGVEAASSPPIVDAAMRQKLVAYHKDLCDWIMTLDVGSGMLKKTRDTRWSIFINGNFARVLMAGYEVHGEKSYLKEALRWAEAFCKQQQPAQTPGGEEAGYWGDRGSSGNIYFGDAGTATTAFALLYHYADKARQPEYLAAMQRYATFVTKGTAEAPKGRGKKGCDGWVIASGADRGALGCGYYRGHLSTKPYTIATGTTGGAFFASLHRITDDRSHLRVASGAVNWLLKSRKPSGEIPYTLDGRTVTSWPLDTMTYCSEAFLALHAATQNAVLKKSIVRRAKPSVDWLVRTQNADGSWGTLRSADQQRSPSVVSLLAWHCHNGGADPKVGEAVRKYCTYLLDPANSKSYGVKSLVRTTGFVGLAIAEVLRPGVTFRASN